MTAPRHLDAWQPASVHRLCLAEVAAGFGVPVTAMASRSRRKPVSAARQAGYWVVRQRFARLSWPMIGKLFGGRDHSTVIYGAREAEARRAGDPEYRALTDALAQGRPGAMPERELVLAIAAAERADEERREAEARRAEERRIEAEVRDFPDPRTGLLNIQLKGQHGCPGLSPCEIARRRDGVLAARRARELALLEIEAARYGLPRRGRALSEMVA